MNKKDPHATREAIRYEHPIPSREFILEQIALSQGSLKRKQLATKLNLDTELDLEALKRRLGAMVRDGQLVRVRSAYMIPTEKRIVQGTLKLEKDGSGSVSMSKASGAPVEKIYLAQREVRNLCEGDELEVRLTHQDNRGQSQGVVLKVLHAEAPQLIGRYQALPDSVVIPRHRLYRMPISVHSEAKLQSGDWVLVQVKRGETGREEWQGTVITVLGTAKPFDLEYNTVIAHYNIPHEWSDEVVEYAATLPKEVKPAAKKNRLDLRPLPLVTIDGEDARDFDDAVYCERRSRGGFRLWVAIADVSYYVKAGSVLDKEARERGTSVYFPDKVIPMLPESLSNGLCSLKPKEDRLCVACELTISAKGVVTDAQFHRAVMRSEARLTYTEVADMLAGDQKLQQKYAALWPAIQVLQELFQVLHQERQERGAIEFETIETRMVFNDKQEVENIIPVTRNVAHRIIEECMLLANVAAAKFLIKEDIPTLFRVHAGPTQEKLRDLRNYLAFFALSLPGKNNPKPKDYARLLSEIEHRPDVSVLQTVMLRSLSQAVYSPKNIGHFGLAYPAYVHFTSPIRRYPDLLVHRAITAAIENKKPKLPGNLEALGEHCSVTERRADEASREIVLAMKCHYIQKHLGDVFDAIITAVTSFGLFAELKNLYVEGLIHVSNLGNDYYIYDQTRHQLRGEHTGATFNIGDHIRVCLAHVDIDERKIDLELLSGGSPSGQRKNTTSHAKKKFSPKDKKRTQKRSSKISKKKQKRKAK